jgi:nitrate reductase NapAB chaperone NapD
LGQRDGFSCRVNLVSSQWQGFPFLVTLPLERFLMSILGVVVRVRPKDLDAVKQRLAHTPGVDLGSDAGDGRLIAVLESTDGTPAAAIMAGIAGWREVHNLSLVFEHSGGDPALADTADFDFRAWRGHVGDFARRQQAQSASFSVPPPSTSALSGAGETR